MGECLITRRGGETHKLPILNPNYPEDVSTTVIGEDTGSATFHVDISEPGNPAVYTYQWYVNGVPITGATSASYTMSDLSTTETYTVYCEVTNKKGTVTSRMATLNVTHHFTPTLNANYPEDATVTVTFDATFKVEVSKAGYPDSYTYQWYVNGSAVTGATGTSFTHYRSLEGSDEVYCEVTNGSGTVRSRTATLTANRLYLYNYGEQYAYFTGGWVAARTGANSSDGYVNSLTHASDHLSILGRANEYYGGAATGWKLDLSKHTRVNAIVSSNSDVAGMYVSSTLTGFMDTALASKAIPTTLTTISIDITNISAGHIAFTAPATGEVGYSTWVRAVWLG